MTSRCYACTQAGTLFDCLELHFPGCFDFRLPAWCSQWNALTVEWGVAGRKKSGHDFRPCSLSISCSVHSVVSTHLKRFHCDVNSYWWNRVLGSDRATSSLSLKSVGRASCCFSSSGYLFGFSVLPSEENKFSISILEVTSVFLAGENAQETTFSVSSLKYSSLSRSNKDVPGPLQIACDLRFRLQEHQHTRFGEVLHTLNPHCFFFLQLYFFLFFILSFLPSSLPLSLSFFLSFFLFLR